MREQLWGGEKRKHSELKTHGVSPATCWSSDVRRLRDRREACDKEHEPTSPAADNIKKYSTD